MATRMIAVCLAVLPLLAHGHLTYVSRLPNGDRIPVAGVVWPALGHDQSSGGGPRNVFGLAFAAAGHQWTLALCNADSDGDGFSNGAELGDPECVWTPGAAPARTTGLSHPALDWSVPVATAPRSEYTSDTLITRLYEAPDGGLPFDAAAALCNATTASDPITGEAIRGDLAVLLTATEREVGSSHVFNTRGVHAVWTGGEWEGGGWAWRGFGDAVPFTDNGDTYAPPRIVPFNATCHPTLDCAMNATTGSVARSALALTPAGYRAEARGRRLPALCTYRRMVAVVGGKRLFINTALSDYATAKTRCSQAPGGRVAQPLSLQENTALLHLLWAAGLRNAWLGGSDAATEGRWVWDGATTPFYSGGACQGYFCYWGAGEPNNLVGGNEDVVGIYWRFPAGEWNDHPVAGTVWAAACEVISTATVGFKTFAAFPMGAPLTWQAAGDVCQGHGNATVAAALPEVGTADEYAALISVMAAHGQTQVWLGGGALDGETLQLRWNATRRPLWSTVDGSCRVPFCRWSGAPPGTTAGGEKMMLRAGPGDVRGGTDGWTIAPPIIFVLGSHIVCQLVGGATSDGGRALALPGKTVFAEPGPVAAVPRFAAAATCRGAGRRLVSLPTAFETALVTAVWQATAQAPGSTDGFRLWTSGWSYGTGRWAWDVAPTKSVDAAVFSSAASCALFCDWANGTAAATSPAGLSAVFVRGSWVPTDSSLAAEVLCESADATTGSATRSLSGTASASMSHTRSPAVTPSGTASPSRTPASSRSGTHSLSTLDSSSDGISNVSSSSSGSAVSMGSSGRGSTSRSSGPSHAASSSSSSGRSSSGRPSMVPASSSSRTSSSASDGPAPRGSSSSAPHTAAPTPVPPPASSSSVSSTSAGFNSASFHTGSSGSASSGTPATPAPESSAPESSAPVVSRSSAARSSASSSSSQASSSSAPSFSSISEARSAPSSGPTDRPLPPSNLTATLAPALLSAAADDALGGAAVGAGVFAAVAGGATVGLHMTRAVGLAAHIDHCLVRPSAVAAGPVPRLWSLTQWHWGDSDGQYFRGAVAANVIVMAGCTLLAAAVVAALTVTPAADAPDEAQPVVQGHGGPAPDDWGSRWLRASAILRFPSILALPGATLLLGTVAAAVAGLRHGEGLDLPIAVAAFVIVAGLGSAVLYVSTSASTPIVGALMFRAAAWSGCLAPVLLPVGLWVPRPVQLAHSDVPRALGLAYLFMACLPRARAFLLVEACFTVAAGVVFGLLPDSRDYCRGTTVAAAALAALHAVVCVAWRPLTVRLVNGVMAVASIVEAVAATLAAVVLFQSDPDTGLLEAAVWAALGAAALLLLGTVLLLGVMLYLSLQGQGMAPAGVRRTTQFVDEIQHEMQQNESLLQVRDTGVGEALDDVFPALKPEGSSQTSSHHNMPHYLRPQDGGTVALVARPALPSRPQPSPDPRPPKPGHLPENASSSSLTELLPRKSEKRPPDPPPPHPKRSHSADSFDEL